MVVVLGKKSTVFGDQKGQEHEAVSFAGAAVHSDAMGSVG